MEQIRPCTEQEAAFIAQSLKEYNFSVLDGPDFRRGQPFNLAAQDESGAVTAGVLAQMYFGSCVYVSYLWVSGAARGKGLGARLLGEVERLAKAEGCTLIHLDTFDFQARGFYEKLSYTVFGVLEDCPPGHCRYYLTKRL